VGIYIGNNKMIHAPRPGKTVEIVDISWHVRNYRIKGARRI
jgi:cell wall-associated NlpC family hydrolase